MGLIQLLERNIASFFRRMGNFLGLHPLKVIIIVMILTGITSLGLLNFEEINNIRTEYSPINAPSRKEYKMARTFLGQVRNYAIQFRCYHFISSSLIAFCFLLNFHCFFVDFIRCFTKKCS